MRFLKKKGLITRSLSALRTKRKRVFNKHAKIWGVKDYGEINLGEHVRIDHMTVSKNGITIKHFQTWERKLKYIDAAVYSNAKASSTKHFLIDFVKQVLFPIKSVLSKAA